MKSKPLILILTAGLFLCSAHSLQASVDSMLTLVLKGYTQQKTTSNGITETAKVDLFRIDSKQLLVLLGKQLGTKYPAGAQLKVAVDGKVYVADSKGGVISDVSAYFLATFDWDHRLVNGQRNLVSGQENTDNYFALTFTMNLAVLQGTVRGIAIEKFGVTARNHYGLQIASGLTSSAVNGSGSYAGKAAYFDGLLKLQGKASVAATIPPINPPVVPPDPIDPPVIAH